MKVPRRIFLINQSTHWLLLVALLLGGTGLSKAQTYTGVVDGIVTDSTGGAVAGAEVTLTNTATGETHTMQSAEDGRYTFSQLNPSTYSIKVSKPGFHDYVGSGVVLNASQTREVNVGLQLGE
jgi:hypothetical protein